MMKGLVVVVAWVLAAGMVGAQGTLPGDANGDCRVDGVDFVVLLNHYGQITSGGVSVGDFNTDGRVDGVDFVILLNYYGQVCQGTPTPTSIPTSAAGTNYYVSTAGNDANPGTQTQPWRTIQKAANTMVAGDTTYIQNGIYYRESIDLTGSTGVEGKSGDATSGYISYIGASRDGVIIDGTGLPWSSGFTSGTAARGHRVVNYIKISNMTIRNFLADGVQFYSDKSDGVYPRIASHDIILDNLKVHDNTIGGIMFSGGEEPNTGYNFIVRNSEVFNNHGDHHGIKFSGDPRKIYNGEHIHDSIIENNLVYNNDKLGIHNSSGNYNITIRNNTSHDNGRQGIACNQAWDSVYEKNIVYSNGKLDANQNDGIALWQCRNITISENLIHHNPLAGISIPSDLGDGNPSNFIITNNVIYNNSRGIQLSAPVTGSVIYNNTIALNTTVGLFLYSTITGNTIRNNIFYQNTNQIWDDGGNIFDYNLYYPNTSFPSKGIHGFSADPKFVNPGAGDYHLQSTSPSIDSGIALSSVINDIENITRPQGSGYDIGAYEYVSFSPSVTPTLTPTPTPITSGAQTYYVSSSSGNDSNDGRSETSPWKTLSKVNSFSFKPGDKVLFQRGGVWTGSGGSGSTALNISSSGIEGQPITFGAYGTGEKPIFRNPPLETNHTRAIVVNASYIIVENVKVQDTHEAGVYIGNASSNVIVRGIEATNVGQGVIVQGQNHLVTNNYIHDLHLVHNDCEPTPPNDCSTGNDDYGAVGVIFANGSNNEVSYNKIVNAKAPSYDYITDGGVFEWWGNSDNNYVHHNWGENSNGFFEVGGQSGNHAFNNVVAYNVSLNNDSLTFIHVGGIFGVDASFRVENNTIIETQPHDPMQWAMFGFIGSPNVNTLFLRNNIFYLDDVQRVSPADSRGWVFTHENNLYYFLDNRTTLGFPLALGEKIADPLLVSVANKDFHLQPNSPAIDAGLDLKYLLDFDNHQVPTGIALDIGAYEYSSDNSIPTPTRVPTLTVAPSSVWTFMITFQGIPPSTGFNLSEKSVRVRLVNTETGATVGPTTVSVTPNLWGSTPARFPRLL